MFVIEDRRLVKNGSKPGQLATLHLEEVRDHLRAMSTRQDPRDDERTLNQLHVSFDNKRMTARWLTPSGLAPETMVVSATGAQHLAQQVLPPRFFSGLRTLAHIDDQGGKLATMAWAKFAQACETPRMVRTVNIRLDDKAVRMVRSVHSQDYSPYSHLSFVEDLLAHGDSLTSKPVVEFMVTDSAMRLRFALDEIELRTPVRMFEAWNSEVGLRRVGLRGGLWKLICTNGMGGWDNNTEYNWVHRGSADRIRRGVASAMQNLSVTASGVVDAYKKALDVAIEDAYVWMERELLMMQVSGDRADRVKQALTDPTTTPGFTLASAVDSLTLVAQQENDIFVQEALESAAAKMLHRNLILAQGQGNRLSV